MELSSVWREKALSGQVKMDMFERIVVPGILYGCETWSLNVRSRKKIYVLEIKCF